MGYVSRFTLTMTGLNIPGVSNKEPDQSLRPRRYPDPTVNNHQQVMIRANGRPWPTLVIEMGRSESVASIRQHRQMYLNGLAGLMYTLGSLITRSKLERPTHGIVGET